MLERTVESHFKRRAIAAGCEVRKVKWIGRRNCPDRVLMIPHQVLQRSGLAALFDVTVLPPTVWVELKRPGEKPSSAQWREHERMRKAGQHVEVFSFVAQVDYFFDKHFYPWS